MWYRVLAALVSSLILAVPAAAAPVGTPFEEITALVAAPLASPEPVLGADNRIHLVYELFVTNPSSSVMRLTELDILNASRGDSLIKAERGSKIIATLTGGDLDGATDPLVPATELTVGPAQVTRLFLDATFARGAHIPQQLGHRFTFTLTSSSGAVSTEHVISGRTPVHNRPPVVVGAPLSGRGWVASGGCCFPASYHRTATLPVNGAFHAPERFAIDFVQLNAQGRLFSGPQSNRSSYAYFGANVLAVADGVVVGLQDGLPEETPPNGPANPTAQTAGGNYLVINIGHGRFAFYAHMQPGSLRVRLHEHVKRGQVIGLLGNTGNSTGPHLHFHIMNGPGPLSSEGLPFEIQSFSVEGTVTSSMAALEDGGTATIGPAGKGAHHRQLPLQDEVIDFP